MSSLSSSRTMKAVVFILSTVLLAHFTAVQGRNHAFETNNWKHRSRMPDNHHRRAMELEEVQKPQGDEKCPCLTYEQMNDDDSKFPAKLIEGLVWETASGGVWGADTYGLGCDYHDNDRGNCTSATCATEVPLPNNCDFSWCTRAFCYVDPNNCSLLNRPSPLFQNRFYSYATCGFMDSFTSHDRLSSLARRTFRVGFNANSGGWKGAYNRDGSFSTNDQWSGPMVDFIEQAAREGDFNLQITAPPDWLRNESKKFFGGSSFDYCVYATALGYLDLCVSSYTITDKRASVTPFFETYSDPIYLVTKVEDSSSNWEKFLQSFKTIFQPFTPQAWLLIWLFVLPILSLCMLFHERHTPGSVFPTTSPVLRVNKETGSKVIDHKKIPLRTHIGNSLYTTVLSLFTEYDQSVVSLGGKINVIALVSFNLTILTVYTANLAAILTQEYQVSTIHNLDDAIKAGYNFCAERKVAELVTTLHKVDIDKIVIDPVDLGGDGKPGFNCPKCQSRDRVFDYIRTEHSNASLYCNAAFASLEDLEVLQNNGAHCNKKIVGNSLAYQSLGFPIFDKEADGLVSLLYSVKYNGAIDRYLGSAEPENRCPAPSDNEGNSLTIQQLTGVWVLTFTLAFVGIVTTLVERYKHKKARKNDKEIVVNLRKVDQWGNPASHDIVVDGHRFDPGEFTLEPLSRSKSLERDCRIMSSRSLLNVNTSSSPTKSPKKSSKFYPRASSVLSKTRESTDEIDDYDSSDSGRC
mmetsp:Transcript_21343/g.32892  ORF Transcript_21343/g.32892 Transcript_21343/m.32892 type:complete len:747 (+) Transcript_21343:37-2277(+)